MGRPLWGTGAGKIEGQTQALLEGPFGEGGCSLEGTPSTCAPHTLTCFPQCIPASSGLPWPLCLLEGLSGLSSLQTPIHSFKPWLKYLCFQEALPDIPSQCPWPGIPGKMC